MGPGEEVMIAITSLVFVGVVMVGVLLLLGLRRWTLDDTRTEALLRSPDTHTVVYVVLDGQDPVDLMAALSRSGFVCVADSAGGTERLLVACDETDRGNVRSIIEDAGRRGLGAPRMQVANVRFEDETGTAPA
jgi:hypothetical protein